MFRVLNPVPTPKPPIEHDDFQKEYDTLASKLGVNARVAPSTTSVLQELAISIYDLAAVERYLDRKGHWCWRPLRRVDIASDGKVWRLERETYHIYPYSHGRVESDQYLRPVPYPVLCVVERLVERCGADILFMVAALEKKPDPFLGCLLHSENPKKMTVIERWDEPGFRSR